MALAAEEPRDHRPWPGSTMTGTFFDTPNVHSTSRPPLPVKDRDRRKMFEEAKKHRPGQNSLRHAKNSTEELRKRTRDGGSIGNIVTDGGSAGRTGRQFTVGNIGNNGLLYLRPVIRPANQRNQPPPFTFPPNTNTPPDSATVQTKTLPAPAQTWGNFDLPDLHTPRSPTFSEAHIKRNERSHSRAPSSRPSHHRAHSFSTIGDHTHADSAAPGTFKVVIDRPQLRRPKTADTRSFPLLDIPIPSYKIGTPRFSARGTPYIRSSVLTRTSTAEEQHQSSYFCGQDLDKLHPVPPLRHPSTSTARQSDYTPSPSPAGPSNVKLADSDKMGSCISTTRKAGGKGEGRITPEIYDHFVTAPYDSSTIRYHPLTGQIVAITPSHLIYHITSPGFLDYDALSDFFLTYRLFLTPNDLLSRLIARLEWAFNRKDGIVCIRTFVALRHWILNYIDDDFAPNYEARRRFCESVNTLYRTSLLKGSGENLPIKILSELKRCWKRITASSWGIGGSDTGMDSADEHISPGPRLLSRFFEANTNRSTIREGMIHNMLPVAHPPSGIAPLTLDSFPDVARLEFQAHQSLTSAPLSTDVDGIPTSPVSEQSSQIISCSIPLRSLHRLDPSSKLPLNPHPVPLTQGVAGSNIAPSKASRPSHTHKRSGSFSDALRDNRAPVSLMKGASYQAQILAAYAVGGRLIRGAALPPWSASFEITFPTFADLGRPKENVISSSAGLKVAAQGVPANLGVRKILGSVRRALSSRQPATEAQYPRASTDRSTLSSARNPSGYRPGFGASSTQLPRRRRAGTKTEVRVDLMTQLVAESFQKALDEEIRAQKGRAPAAAATAEQDDDQLTERDLPRASAFTTGVTTGSRSIVIVDDTSPLANLPVMSGALPPSTLESPQGVRTQHRSTLASSTAFNTELIQKPLPVAFPPDADTISTRRGTIPSLPPLTRASLLQRSRSHRSARSGSTSLRRYASFQSGMSRHLERQASQASTMDSQTDPFEYDNLPQSLKRGQLRRRPAADLRAVNNAQEHADLPYPMERAHSTGSLSTWSHSVTNSVVLAPHNTMASELPPRPVTPATEPVTPAPQADGDAHQSFPDFVNESVDVAKLKLAELADDVEDDGGPEATLLKLEGRYQKKKTPVYLESQGVAVDETEPTAEIAQEHAPSSLAPSNDPVSSTAGGHSTPGGDQRQHPLSYLASSSAESFSSIPLLSRSSSERSRRRMKQRRRDAREAAKQARMEELHAAGLQEALKPNMPLSPALTPAQEIDSLSQHQSIEVVEETDSMRQIPHGATVPSFEPAHDSFLLDENQDLSDQESPVIVPVDAGRKSHLGGQSFYEEHDDDDDDDDFSEINSEVLPHPLRLPPTPPLNLKTERRSPYLQNDQFQHMLPSPLPSPQQISANKFESPPASNANDLGIELTELRKPTITVAPPPPKSQHLPFILAYDTQTLVEQFTLIEKDALEEIHWRELIELRWNHFPPVYRDWVQYLQSAPTTGVDIVIARFNIIVKWAISECMLTDDADERVRVFIKYIRIAAACRRIKNYATMYQITIALLSSDCARLTRTWERVPDEERELLRQLEELVQPTRNFHNLRVEMETADTQEGCIPFIGIYTHDLIYNAQKPLYIDAPPAFIGPQRVEEPLANFEKCRTAAGIAKGLLRLLDAASKYSFKPVPEVLSRCLWMAALGDGDILERSRRLE